MLVWPESTQVKVQPEWRSFCHAAKGGRGGVGGRDAGGGGRVGGGTRGRERIWERRIRTKEGEIDEQETKEMGVKRGIENKDWPFILSLFRLPWRRLLFPHGALHLPRSRWAMRDGDRASRYHCPVNTMEILLRTAHLFMLRESNNIFAFFCPRQINWSARKLFARCWSEAICMQAKQYGYFVND